MKEVVSPEGLLYAALNSSVVLTWMLSSGEMARFSRARAERLLLLLSAFIN